MLALFYYSILFVYRIVQAFESILDTLIDQENFTNIRVIEEDVTLIAEQVSKGAARHLVTH